MHSTSPKAERERYTMNTKKTIIFTLIAIPLLFSASCIGKEIITSSAQPAINPNQTQKMTISGKTAFVKECRLLFNIKYASNDSFGNRQTKWIKIPATLKNDGTYEITVYNDHFQQTLSAWKMVAFSPEFQCPGYTQGGIAILNMSDKSKLSKRAINCTKEHTEKFGKRVTCAISDTRSLGFEEISNSQAALNVDIVDKGLNAPYYELIK